MNVPLLAYYPPGFGKNITDKRPVSLVDIAPTIYQLAGVEPGHILDGHSLLSDNHRKEQFSEFTNERSIPVRERTWWRRTIQRTILVNDF